MARRRKSTNRIPKRLRLIDNRKPRRRARKTGSRSQYGAIFFAILAVTVASTLGFFGIVASVLAGS